MWNKGTLNKQYDLKKIYIVAAFVGLVGLIGALIVTNGRYFRWFFYADALDTGMDFLNSMAETHGGDPYGRFTTLYTPLCNLFFFILQMMVPASVTDKWPDSHRGFIEMRATADDMRVQQSCLMIYLLYVLVLAVVWIFCVMWKYHRHMEAGAVWGTVIGGLSLLSYSSLVNIDRGNVVNMTALFLLLFLFGFRSKTPWIRELSYVALAVAAGLRMYPAVFGIFLLADKDWKGAAKSVIYGLLSVFMPLFVFGGIGDIKIFIGQLFGFNVDEPVYMYNYGMKNIVYHLAGFGTDGRVTPNATLDRISGICLIICAVILIAAFFIHDKVWLKALDITILMTLVQNQGDDHVLIFFVPVLVCMFLEEASIERSNVLYIVSIFLLTIAYPSPQIGSSYFMTLFHADIVQLVFVIVIIYEAVKIITSLRQMFDMTTEKKGRQIG